MNKIDRRALFSSGAAAALLAATGVSLDAAPQPGGRLRLALPRDGVSLDRLARGAALDTLTEIAPNGVLQGELANSWKSDEARNWQIDLRENVRFHDGTTLTAEDVVSSLCNRDVRSRLKATLVEPLSATSLRLELVTANPHLPILLADPMFAICAGGSVDAPLASVIGTGCYQTERFQADRHYLGRKVPDHYKAGQAGWLDSIEAVVIPDPRIRSEALRDGYVDVAMLPEPGVLQGQDGMSFYPTVENMVVATRSSVGFPKGSTPADLSDDGRLAERWWRS